MQGDAGQECPSDVLIAASGGSEFTETFSVVPRTTDAQPETASAAAKAAGIHSFI
ncbi:hypothetical protein MESS2_1250009 [Mesorhizobium metallidurans STM 2683]|uniref:Uncharacterized protein n=1 Tax=Mesorhizobium metallidurans STM 2683 TaxID=1297569 RepID=M5EI11_9HYPH|nr:hypothetical protein MESS2_1250009 [Mesorhizobium metallidurans STM 2683]